MHVLAQGKVQGEGKHPVPLGGCNAATCDPDVISGWFCSELVGRYNIGVATGQPSGVFAVNVDRRNDGDKRLAELEEANGKLPDTVIAETGNGVHHYFRMPEGMTIKSRPLCSGIDIKADGGMVIAPPSRHKNGTTYRWATGRAPWERDFAEAPAWLLDKVAGVPSAGGSAGSGSGKTAVRADAGPVAEGQRHDFLVREAGRLRYRRFEHDDLERELLKINGEKCAPPLDDAEVRRIASDIAKKAPGPLSKLSAPSLAVAPSGASEWRDRLIYTPKGELVSTVANVATILGNDERWDGVLAFNEFTLELDNHALPVMAR